MNKLLLLEDNADRINDFRSAVEELGPDWQLVLWQDAPSMLSSCEQHFEDVRLISLDHDLNPQPGASCDPGTGRHVAQLLAGHLPLCPVIIHSTNADAAWSMHNDLRFAGWHVERVGPIGNDWVRKLWLPKVRELLATSAPAQLFRKSPEHCERVRRALVSLEGLALGDAIGEMLAPRFANAPRIIAEGLPAGPWFRTDDSEMAISVVEVLQLYGYINRAALSRRFAWRFEREPDRGYGSGTRIQLAEILRGEDWQKLAADAFGGQGSMGNGGAMRVAPLGAFFADDLERVRAEAELSARVTHTHPEAVAGTISVAIAAAVASQPNPTPARIFETALAYTPESKVRDGINRASTIPFTADLEAVAKTLGNGSHVTAQDTVPFTLWSAARHLHDFVEGIAQTIRAGGDCDTNAAIVGGIIACATGLNGIPADWRTSKEPSGQCLELWLTRYQARR
jgi:ADP-ribosylglycohydrolase